MHSNKKITLKFLGLLMLTALALTACNIPVVSGEAEILSENTVEEAATDEPVDSEPADVLAADEQPAVTVNANGLTDVEIDGLLYMREEEKLAHDVYLTLYDIWGLPLFQNIANSEQTHTDAVKQLLDHFGIADPAADTAVGVFTNPTLQGLYDDLTALGSQSLGDALRVGAAIEEIDIIDLQENLSDLTNSTIRQVYENLLNGSENHLRAFVSTLARQTGDTYTPQYLTEAIYNAIISASTQNNAPMQGGGRGQGRRP